MGQDAPDPERHLRPLFPTEPVPFRRGKPREDFLRRYKPHLPAGVHPVAFGEGGDEGHRLHPLDRRPARLSRRLPRQDIGQRHHDSQSGQRRQQPLRHRFHQNPSFGKGYAGGYPKKYSRRKNKNIRESWPCACGLQPPPFATSRFSNPFKCGIMKPSES